MNSITGPIQDNNAAAQEPRTYIRIYPESSKDVQEIEWAIECCDKDRIILRTALATMGTYLIKLPR